MRVLNLVTSESATFFQQQNRALQASGVEVETISVDGNPDAGEHRSPLAYASLVPKTLYRSFDDFDLVHANNGLTAPAALAQPRLPVVVSLWGTDLMGKYGTFTRYFARHADAVIVMTEEMADHLDREAYVVPHAVDLDTFRPIPGDEARAELGWDADSFHVLFPYPEERTVKNYPRARRVVENASQYVEDPVELQTISGVDHDRMPLYYNAADLLLLTSEREGSPNAVKEALACDTPVVSLDVGDVELRVAEAAQSRVCRTDEELVEGVARCTTTFSTDRPRPASLCGAFDAGRIVRSGPE